MKGASFTPVIAQSPPPERCVYTCRVTITGDRVTVPQTAVWFRAKLRRFIKPKGLTMQVSEEIQRKAVT